MADTVASLLAEGVAALTRAGVPSPDVDAELIVGHVLGLSRGGVHARALTGSSAAPEEVASIRSALDRRSAREPLQHITGTAAFRSLELRVGPGVFVPRPETETVAQLAIDALLAVASSEPVAVDLGTGSGALALALGTEVPHARVVGVEKSAEAFAWASENVRLVGAPNVRVVLGDLGSALDELDGSVDVVVSNPPYIPDDAVPRDLEVRLHDPTLALYGGPDGLDVVRVVSRRARALLRRGGALVVEHGELQGDAMRSLLREDGWVSVATHRDLTLRDRVTTAVR